MDSLFVLYDARCGICTQLKAWLGRQPAFVRLHFIALGTAEARMRFPALDSRDSELAVIADTGEAWFGDRAWITCLWALREYRSWARKLSTPTMLPLARQAFLALSGTRFELSRLLGLRNDEDMRRHLTETTIPPCQIHP